MWLCYVFEILQYGEQWLYAGKNKENMSIFTKCTTFGIIICAKINGLKILCFPKSWNFDDSQVKKSTKKMNCYVSTTVQANKSKSSVFDFI